MATHWRNRRDYDGAAGCGCAVALIVAAALAVEAAAFLVVRWIAALLF